MRFLAGSWQMSIRADEGLTVFALWLRDVEGIEVPPSPLVPGPLDMRDLPARTGGAARTAGRKLAGVRSTGRLDSHP